MFSVVPIPPFPNCGGTGRTKDHSESNRYLALNFADPAHPGSSVSGHARRRIRRERWTIRSSVARPWRAGGGLYLHEYGWTDNGIPRAPLGLIYAESGNIVAGEGDKRLHVTQLVFDADGPPDRSLGYRFFPREQPHDAASEYDTGLYTVIHGGLMDVRFSGSSIRMRMEA